MKVEAVVKWRENKSDVHKVELHVSSLSQSTLCNLILKTGGQGVS